MWVILLKRCPRTVHCMHIFTHTAVQAHSFFALLMIKFYFLHKSALSLNTYDFLYDSNNIYCIWLENHNYDSVTTGIGWYVSVQEATPFLTPSPSWMKSNGTSLAFYLERLTKENNLAAVIVIMNGTTISLVGQNNNAIAPIDQA